VAAPTAGLHLTEPLLERVESVGARLAEVVLHVGPGTFRPIGADQLASGRLHEEAYVLPDETAEAIARTRAAGGRVIAVGTTSARVLESCAREDGCVTAGAGSTDLFLRPGSPIRVVNGLLTNFHLPRSSLLLLVAAMVGRKPILDAYAHAVNQGYRFYSYGDAMLIL
jgi:S-adenosylmethionine:tRNA ribosyltransferase-isomerase